MRLLLAVLILLILSESCITPDQWSAQEHRAQMRQCSLACGEGRMASYDAWSAKCKCGK